MMVMERVVTWACNNVASGAILCITSGSVMRVVTCGANKQIIIVNNTTTLPTFKLSTPLLRHFSERQVRV